MVNASLKQKLARGELVVGTLMTFDFWAGYLEIYKQVGMDFVFLDMEHGAADLAKAEELCRTARLLDLPLILRPEDSVYHLLRRYADMGPSGFMIPWTESEEQLETVKSAIYVPPRGRRGPGGPSVMRTRSLDLKGWQEVEDDFFVCFQVETPRGIEALPGLAARDWIDAVMLGPYDLSLNLGHCGEWDHPVVVDAILRVLEGARAAGKPCGMVVGSLEQGRFWIERGFHFLSFGEATGMVRAQASAFLSAIRE